MTANQFEQIDRAFRLIDRQVWVVTAMDGQRRGGLLATWIMQASIDSQQPVVVAGIAPNHFTAELIDASGCFALHLLRADQIDVALNFALGSGRSRDKLAGLPTTATESGSPILRDCMAWFECRVFAALPTGDRVFYWGDVRCAHTSSEGPALTEQVLIRGATDEQRQQLRADRETDIAQQRPGRRQWRANLPALLRVQEADWPRT